MSRARNTRDEIIPIPALHGVSVPGAIEAQEAQGGAAMAAGDCTVIPVSGYEEAELEELGFTLGTIDPFDDLFREATLPLGWKRDGTGHAMHTNMLDELGRMRCGIFYKAAWYDRRADLTITTVYGYVGTCLYEKTSPVLDEEWATGKAVHAAAVGHFARAAKYLPMYESREDEYGKERAAELRAEISACQALIDSLASQATTGGAV